MEPHSYDLLCKSIHHNMPPYILECALHHLTMSQLILLILTLTT